MAAVLAFSATLLAGVLLSGLAHRSVLSTAVLFLGVGFLIGDGALGIVSLNPGEPTLHLLAELALVSVLFTDGLRVGVRDLAAAWRLPGRALLLGMPVTLALTAVLAHFLVALPWTQASLLGAALSPTDPVFAVAIVGRSDVPSRLRHLLNVESGLNDGLALPVVVVLLAAVARTPIATGSVVGELFGGVALGIAVPWLAIGIGRLRVFTPSPAYEPLNAFAIGLLVFAVASVTRANAFLAAFAGGMTVASLNADVVRAFHRFGDLVTELLKLAALMAFGIAVPFGVFSGTSLRGYAFALMALLLIRPIAIGIALFGTGIARREWIAAAWFGPKGFASVVYGLLVLEAGVPLGAEVFRLMALVITLSIAAHSSTDVIVARWFRSTERPEAA